MKKIITASIVAIMAVTAAHADIASTTYVDSRTGDPTSLTTTAKNLTGAVNELAGKLSSGNLTIAKDAVGTDQLANDAVTADKLATNSVLSDNIQDGEVKTDDIADSAVTSAKIASGTIVNEHIAADANIDQSKIAGLGNALNAKEDVSNKASQVTTGMDKAKMYPTVALTETLIAGANQDMSSLIGDVADGKTVVGMITEGDSALGLRVTDIEESDYANSGITSTKVGAYDGHVADKDIHVTTADKTAWNAKQNALTEGQLAAVNSGVTTATVSQVTMNKNDITNIKNSDYANSGITATKVGAYDDHVADKDIHVTAVDKAAWKAKVATAQGADNKDKAMITDENGNVKPGQIVSGMITDGEVKADDIATNAVTTAKILDNNVTLGKLDQSVQTSLGKADSAMQETALKGLTSWTDQKCGTTGVTCSLVSKDGTIAWEAVKY